MSCPRPTWAVVIGGIEMVIGVSFIAFLTAGVTSTVIQRATAKAQAVERAHDEREAKTILDALVETRRAITELTRVLTASNPRSHKRVGA